MQQLDFLALGDVTTDAFIRLKDAEVHCKVKTSECELCMRFGDKIPYESVTVVRAVGNSPNAAVAAARLGLRSGLVANLGGDENGKECLATLALEKVDTTYSTIDRTRQTNYHYVLWYGADRTILVKHQPYDYALPKFPAPKWLYVSSLGPHTETYHEDMVSYLAKNPEIKLAFQPGSFQIALGTEKLAALYARAEVLVCNREEAERILKQNSLSGHAEERLASSTDALPAGRQGARGIFQQKNIRALGGVPRIRVLFAELRALGPKQVIITDGPAGAYFSDTTSDYFMPAYPDPKPPYERTGAGDAFAATFVSFLAIGKTPLEALHRAPINSAYVVQHIGAQKGLLTREQLEKYLSDVPQRYAPKKL